MNKYKMQKRTQSKYKKVQIRQKIQIHQNAKYNNKMQNVTKCIFYIANKGRTQI